MVTAHYATLTERTALVVELEAQNLVMLHDDFDPDWLPGEEPRGTLTFVAPVPKSAEELRQEALDQEMNDTHAKLLKALENWSTLTLAQKDNILMHLVRYRLWAEGQL